MPLFVFPACSRAGRSISNQSAAGSVPQSAGRVAAALDAYGAPITVVECNSAADLTLALGGDPALLRRFHRPFFPLTPKPEKRA